MCDMRTTLTKQIVSVHSSLWFRMVSGRAAFRKSTLMMQLRRKVLLQSHSSVSQFSKNYNAENCLCITDLSRSPVDIQQSLI